MAEVEAVRQREGELIEEFMERFGVSRGTIRRALELRAMNDPREDPARGSADQERRPASSLRNALPASICQCSTPIPEEEDGDIHCVMCGHALAGMPVAA